MGEVTKKESQTMIALMDNTIRGIIKLANEKGIKREDVVAFFRDKDQFVLVYFG